MKMSQLGSIVCSKQAEPIWIWVLKSFRSYSSSSPIEQLWALLSQKQQFCSNYLAVKVGEPVAVLLGPGGTGQRVPVKRARAGVREAQGWLCEDQEGKGGESHALYAHEENRRMITGPKNHLDESNSLLRFCGKT